MTAPDRPVDFPAVIGRRDEAVTVRHSTVDAFDVTLYTAAGYRLGSVSLTPDAARQLAAYLTGKAPK